MLGRRASRDELQLGKLADAAARESAGRAAHHQLPQLPPSLTQLPPSTDQRGGGKGGGKGGGSPAPCGGGGKGGKGMGFPRRRALCDSPQRQLAASPGGVLGGGAPSAGAPSVAPSAAPSAHVGRAGGGRAQCAAVAPPPPSSSSSSLSHAPAHAPAATRDAPPPPRDCAPGSAQGLGAATGEVVPLSALRIDTGLLTTHYSLLTTYSLLLTPYSLLLRWCP